MARRDRPEQARRAVHSRARRIDAQPAAALRAFTGPRAVWTDPDGPELVGCEVAASVVADGPERFGTVKEKGGRLLRGVRGDVPAPARPRLLGGFAFHDEHDPGAPWRGFPGARFVLPRVQVVAEDGETWLTVSEFGNDPDVGTALDDAAEAVADAAAAGERRDPPPGIESTRRTPTREMWREEIDAAVGRIRGGELEKVVLAQALEADLRGPFRLSDALERLAGTYPDCHRFAVDPGVGAVFFGATPERLVRLAGTEVETEALAGSAGRGATEAEDERLADTLRTPKIEHEHALVARTVREQLAAMGAEVSVGDRGLKKLANVQHLHTPITADAPADTHVIDVAERLHPTPAVGGLPPEAAWRTIKETEAFERGWYAAPVGWFDAAGDGSFAVGIRSAVAGEDTATLFAGNGIVADSDPDVEWDELQLKFRPMLDQLR
jgi:menaquinone-specific isochorismate synthase